MSGRAPHGEVPARRHKQCEPSRRFQPVSAKIREVFLDFANPIVTWRCGGVTRLPCPMSPSPRRLRLKSNTATALGSGGVTGRQRWLNGNYAKANAKMAT